MRSGDRSAVVEAGVAQPETPGQPVCIDRSAFGQQSGELAVRTHSDQGLGNTETAQHVAGFNRVRVVELPRRDHSQGGCPGLPPGEPTAVPVWQADAYARALDAWNDVGRQSRCCRS